MVTIPPMPVKPQCHPSIHRCRFSQAIHPPDTALRLLTNREATTMVTRMNITLDHRATPRLPKATKTYPTAPTQRYNSIHTERKTTQVHGIEARALIIKNHDCFLFALLEMKIRQNSYFIPFPSSSPGTIYGLRILDSFGSRNDFFFFRLFSFLRSLYST